MAIGKPEMATKVTAAQAQVQARQAALDQARKAFEAGKATLQQAESGVLQVLQSVSEKEKQAGVAKQTVEAADKAVAPIRDQMQKLQASIDAQQKALAEKQAARRVMPTDTATKAQAFTAEIAALKAQLPAVEKAVADAKGKVDANMKTVESHRAAFAQANGALEAVKKQKTDAEAAIVAATRKSRRGTQPSLNAKRNWPNLAPSVRASSRQSEAAQRSVSGLAAKVG